jgi:hypothetical protein
MARAALLLLGAAAYLYYVQAGTDKAMAGIADVQNLYTHASAEAAASNR